MKVYTLNIFAQNNETGFFDEYYDNHGVFIMKHFAEQFTDQHSLNHGETLRYVIEEFELWYLNSLNNYSAFHIIMNKSLVLLMMSGGKIAGSAIKHVKLRKLLFKGECYATFIH